MIGQRLKEGYVREPHVTVTEENCRLFFILGEAPRPANTPMSPMTAENAVAIAGGFALRAKKNKIEFTRNYSGQQICTAVPLNYPMLPGGTIKVEER